MAHLLSWLKKEKWKVGSVSPEGELGTRIAAKKDYYNLIDDNLTMIAMVPRWEDSKAGADETFDREKFKEHLGKVILHALAGSIGFIVYPHSKEIQSICAPIAGQLSRLEINFAFVRVEGVIIGLDRLEPLMWY